MAFNQFGQSLKMRVHVSLSRVLDKGECQCLYLFGGPRRWGLFV
jgi:hypothetical protein